METPFTDFSFPSVATGNEVDSSNEEVILQSPFLDLKEWENDLENEMEWNDEEMVDEEEMEFDFHESEEDDESGESKTEYSAYEKLYEAENPVIKLSAAGPLPVPVNNPVPFAPVPVTGSYWPIITAHPKGREVAFEGTDRKYTGQAGRRFLAQRSDGGRYHAGIDLWANDKDPIVACEDGVIVNFYHFYRSTYALLVEHKNIVINYGEVHQDSLKANNLKIGDTVKAGQRIGIVGKMYSSSMLHFETYKKGTRSNKRFAVGSSAPEELLNPTKYLLFLQRQGLQGIGTLKSSTVSTASIISGKDWTKAIEMNRKYGDQLGWNRNVIEINDLLLKITGQSNISLGEEAFAEAVAAWQNQQGFSEKDSDGVIGPNTWRIMKLGITNATPSFQQPGVSVLKPQTQITSRDAVVINVSKYYGLIKSIGQNKINANIVCGIIAAESGGNPDAGKNGSGYKGLMQADTSNDQLDPGKSIKTGIEKFIDFRNNILNPWFRKLGINIPVETDEIYLKACLSCYNAGPVTALKAIQYAHAGGDWRQWLSPEYYKRALLFSGGYAHYKTCTVKSSKAEIQKAIEEYKKSRKTSWKKRPDPAPWNSSKDIISPIMRCWIETKFKNTPGYLDRFIGYYKYFENNPVVHEMEDVVEHEEEDQFYPVEVYEEERMEEEEITDFEEFTDEEEMEWEDETVDLEEENFNELVMQEAGDTEEEIDEEYDEYEGIEDFIAEEELSYEAAEHEDETMTDHEEWEEDTLEIIRAEQASLENELEIPASTGSMVSTTIFNNWYNSAVTLKSKFPNEPQHNIDQLPIPAWVDSQLFYKEFIQKHGDEAKTIIGDASKKVQAQYFVLHDTAVAADFTQNRIKGKGIHLWVNAKSPVVLGNDWHVKGLGVKLERRKNNSFVHVEITRDKELQKAVQQKTKGKKISYEEISKAGGIKNFGTYYTDKQYELVAYAYIVASIRKGKFLTVTIHREIDRSVVVRRQNGQYGYGHDDPQFFDLNYFYSIICRLLKMPVKVSFGIQNERALAQKQSNMPGYVNSFIPFVTGDATAANQYGELMRLNPQATKYKVIKLKHGYYYDVTRLKNQLQQTEVDDEILFETSRFLSPGSGASPSPGAASISVPRFIAEDLTVPGYTCYVRIDLGKANYPLSMTGIYVPQVFDPKQPVDVLLYLHGMTGTFPGACAQIIDYWSITNLPKYDLRIREEVNAGGRNIILVAPSLGDSPNKYRNDLSGKKQGLDSYLEKVLVAVNSYIIKKRFNSNPINFGNILLAAHSAGGMQMLKIAISDNPIYGPKILECWGFDSLYGRVADVWLSWATKNKDKKLMLYYQSSTEGNARLLESKSKKLSNVFVKKSSAKNHYWIPKEHLKERIMKIGRTGLTKINFEESSMPGHEHFLYETDELVKDWSYAIRQNHNYGNKLGWAQFYDQINDLILPFSGLQNASLGEEAFAQAVASWQQAQGFSEKDSDGIIGPMTWKAMQSFINTNNGYQPVIKVPTGDTAPSTQNIFEFNRWYAQKILDTMTNGILGHNFKSKDQLEKIAGGEQVLFINPRTRLIKILPVIYHIGKLAQSENYKEIIIGSFIRGANSEGKCTGHCAGRCIDINYRNGSFETAGSVQMVKNILSYLISLPARYKKSFGFGMPLQGSFFGDKSLPKFKSASASNLVNADLQQLVPQLGIVFPDNNNHLHIQVNWEVNTASNQETETEWQNELNYYQADW